VLNEVRGVDLVSEHFFYYQQLLYWLNSFFEDLFKINYLKGVILDLFF